MTPLFLEWFSNFIPPGLTFLITREPGVIIFLVVLTTSVAAFAGLYPALVLSGIRPAFALRDQAVAGGGNRSAGIRKGLTVAQFVVAQFFVIGSVIVTKQLHYSLNQDLGFRKEAILNFDMPMDTSTLHRETLLNKISSIPGVQKVSAGSLTPAIDGAAFSNIIYNDGQGEIRKSVQIRFGDASYIDVYNISIVAGRNVRDGKHVEETLINETYARELGFKQPSDALGKELVFNNSLRIPIVGVMHDFHEASFHRPIGSLVFQSRSGGRTFHIALHPQAGDGTSWQETIAGIQKEFANVYPDLEFNYSFYDDSIAHLYAREQNTSILLSWATGLAVLISCLGLLGLVIYTSAARKKEIGIRKVLGATVSNIVSILSSEFIRLIVIAFVIACPLAWWSADRWLQDFAYRTPMSWWAFAGSGLLLLCMGLITLSIQIIRTAKANPIDSLRTE
jgi:hypothetical protein